MGEDVRGSKQQRCFCLAKTRVRKCTRMYTSGQAILKGLRQGSIPYAVTENPQHIISIAYCTPFLTTVAKQRNAIVFENRYSLNCCILMKVFVIIMLNYNGYLVIAI